MPARFVGFDAVRERMQGRSVAVVGSGPSVLSNQRGFVDSHDVVIRVNNHRCSPNAGRRTDVHYSFYGHSIRKSAAELASEGVWLCMCKCPNSQPLRSEWHERNGKREGVDFRYIYRLRAEWWFCDTFVPDDTRFLAKMELLGGHIPTTGFAAILDAIDCQPRSLYVTGFDGFTSKVHNVSEPWKPGREDDPIGHRPEREMRWLAENAERYNITGDGAFVALTEKLTA